MIEESQKSIERVVLVGLITPDQTEEKAKEYLEELRFLSFTAGAEVIEIFQQKLQRPSTTTFVGSGKLEEIRLFCLQNKIDAVIFDDELSASQLRNVEKVLDRKILDRTNLILDIFASRAQTSYASTQVELAQYQYLLPRLTRMWTHLQKQKGGIGMKGPGEKEIETDRRIIRDKISLLKKKLVTIDKQMAVQRKHRGMLVRAALVGYTNVGKSTIMNAVSKSKVLEENKLFATLDTTVRKVVVENLPFLLTDTVGFIRKLPTQLIESFKSTLDEVREADILLHIVDVSHDNFEEHISSVENILGEIGASDKPTLMIFNKTDQFKAVEIDPFDLIHKQEERTLLGIEKRYSIDKAVVSISARKKEDIQRLRSVLFSEIVEIHRRRFPYNNFLYPEIEEE